MDYTSLHIQQSVHKHMYVPHWYDIYTDWLIEFRVKGNDVTLIHCTSFT